MRIQIRYLNNRLDIFDTNTFTKTDPFGNCNMLTNFEIRLDQLGDTGLWLSAHYYDSNPTYKEGQNPSNTPPAHRKRGWKFLLAEGSEVNEIESVVMDGTTILNRINSELVDSVRIERMSNIWLCGNAPLSEVDRILELYDKLTPILSLKGFTPAEISRSCGCSIDLIEELTLFRNTKAEEENDGENWLEGLNDEIND